jgi:hypothetical protein
MRTQADHSPVVFAAFVCIVSRQLLPTVAFTANPTISSSSTASVSDPTPIDDLNHPPYSVEHSNRNPAPRSQLQPFQNGGSSGTSGGIGSMSTPDLSSTTCLRVNHLIITSFISFVIGCLLSALVCATCCTPNGLKRKGNSRKTYQFTKETESVGSPHNRHKSNVPVMMGSSQTDSHVDSAAGNSIVLLLQEPFSDRKPKQFKLLKDAPFKRRPTTIKFSAKKMSFKPSNTEQSTKNRNEDQT